MYGIRNENIIQLFHVCKQYEKKEVISDISLSVRYNEFLFLSGPSGAGKSTMLKLLYVGEPISKGQIIIDGLNLVRITKHNVHVLRRKIGIVFQDFKLIVSKSVFENIALVLEARGYNRKLISQKVNSVLELIGMKDLMNAYPPSLSGGEQQRVAVARAIIGEPPIILADEPTGSLDPESAIAIIELLNEYHKRGATVVIATHDRAIINSTNRRVVYLNSGKVEKDTN